LARAFQAPGVMALPGGEWRPSADEDVSPVAPAYVTAFEGTKVATAFPLKAYEAMRDDRARVEGFEAAIKARMAPGGVTVLEIGPGPFALLSIAAARHGAARVFAIEGNPEAVALAREAVAVAGFADRIEILEGHSTEVDVPEKVNVVIAEILGSIASEEGCVATLRDARRFLHKPDSVDSWIPLGVETYCSPVFLEGHGDMTVEETQQPVRRCSIDPDVCSLAWPQMIESYCFDQPVSLTDVWSRELFFCVQGPARLSGFGFFIRVFFAETAPIEFEDSSTWQQVVTLLAPAPLRLGEPEHTVCVKGMANLTPLPARYTFSTRVT